MKYSFVLFLLFFAIIGCSKDPYHRITGGEFSVQFADPKHQEQAEELALFWKENDLLTGQKQDIGLFREKQTWLVYLIALEPKQMIGFDDQKALLFLQDRLQNEVFEDEPVRIVVCNNQFEPLYDINQ